MLQVKSAQAGAAMPANVLDLPPWEGVESPGQIAEAGQLARAAYLRNRDQIESTYPKGTLILIDGSDPTGRTFTAGTNELDVAMEHHRKHRSSFAVACVFRVGEVPAG